eukprot:g7523.t1
MMTSGNGFPYILHDLLKNEPKSVVTWTRTGTAFGILDNEAFGRDVLSSYFKHNKFSSFQRQLNLYGFRKIVKGRESGCYMHPSFLRDRPDLLSEVRRGVVPPCPESYTRKVYGSGPRFMNQDDESDSEPELIIPSRGNRERSPEPPGGAAGARGVPGAHMQYPHHPGYPAGAGGDPHFQAYPRSMLDIAGGAPPPHQGVLGGAYGGGYSQGAMGVEDNGWGGRPTMPAAGAGGGGGGGGGMYRGAEDAAGAQAYAQQQQQQQQRQQQRMVHHQAQYQMPQQYQMHQQLQEQQYMHRLNTPEAGAGGGAGMWSGVAGGGAAAGSEGGSQIESPVLSFGGRFAEGTDSPMGNGFATPGSTNGQINFERVFDEGAQRQQQQQQQQQQQHWGGRNPAMGDGWPDGTGVGKTGRV